MPSELIRMNLQAMHAIGKARQAKFYWTSSLELNKLGKLLRRTFRSLRFFLGATREGYTKFYYHVNL